MDVKQVIEEIKNKGFGICQNQKLIYSLDVYHEEKERVFTFFDSITPNSLNFAVFRANLYQLRFGNDINDDLELYKKYLISCKMQAIQSNTLFLKNNFRLLFKNANVESQFRRLEQSKQLYILNGFHYGAFRTMLNYLVANDYIVYLLLSNKAETETSYKVEILQQSYAAHGIDSQIHLINVEKQFMLLKLVEVAMKNNVKKTVILTYMEGNKGDISLNKNAIKNYTLLNHEITICNNISQLALSLGIPLVDAVMIDCNDFIELRINDIYDFKNNSLSAEGVTQNIFKSFEKYLDREKIYLWMYLMQLHHFLKKIESDICSEIINNKNYEENRFTEIVLDNKCYIFDSKYYLSYLVELNQTLSKKDKILKLHVKL